MKHTLISIALFTLFQSAAIADTDIIKPESTAIIQVSSTDVNRIKCGDGVISGAHYSVEKNMVVEVKEENAFVKFKAIQLGEKITYSERATELFITCGGDVYELILKPKIMNAKTIYLSNPIKNRIQTSIDTYGQLPIEEQIVKFTIALLTDDDQLLSQFNVKKHKNSEQDWFDFSANVRVGKRRSYNIDGVGLRITEYMVFSNVDRRFNPTEFLDVRLGENILGVTLDPEVLRANEPGKLVVVEKAINNGY